MKFTSTKKWLSLWLSLLLLLGTLPAVTVLAEDVIGVIVTADDTGDIQKFEEEKQLTYYRLEANLKNDRAIYNRYVEELNGISYDETKTLDENLAVLSDLVNRGKAEIKKAEDKSVSGIFSNFFSKIRSFFQKVIEFFSVFI